MDYGYYSKTDNGYLSMEDEVCFSDKESNLEDSWFLDYESLFELGRSLLDNECSFVDNNLSKEGFSFKG